MSDEEWIDISGTIYRISNQGRLYSAKVKRCVKPFLNRDGYFVFPAKTGFIWIHRAVATFFVKNVNECKVVNHIDGNTKNNMASNLEWCTQSENLKKGRLKGIKKNYKRLSSSDRVQILILYREGISLRGISRITSKSRNSIRKTISNEYQK